MSAAAMDAAEVGTPETRGQARCPWARVSPFLIQGLLSSTQRGQFPGPENKCVHAGQ